MSFFKKEKREEVKVDERLSHIAFIMDGNGRWATKRHLPRSAGHVAGAKACERVFRYCKKIGIKTVTIYAFSTENWSRPREEVEALMTLFSRYMDTLLSKYREIGARYVILGDKGALPEEIRLKMEKLERLSAEIPTDCTLNIAINYGARAEITSAVNRLIAEGKKEICEEDITKGLYTAHSPDPDLIIRTAGEARLSNFLLWQASYAELYFTKTLWPDMQESDVDAAILEFYRRTRRFGGVK